jgi:hypothetical protein
MRLLFENQAVGILSAMQGGVELGRGIDRLAVAGS